MVKNAAGIIIFRDKIEYLLLLSSKKTEFPNWTPPKGKLEYNEEFLDAAIRETFEETGLQIKEDYEIINNDFKLISEYPVKEKTVVYWLAKTVDPNLETIKLSDEHVDFRWATLNEAVDLIKYDGMKNVIKKAHEYLMSIKTH